MVYGMDHPSTREALELLHTSQVELGHRQKQDTVSDTVSAAETGSVVDSLSIHF